LAQIAGLDQVGLEPAFFVALKACCQWHENGLQMPDSCASGAHVFKHTFRSGSQNLAFSPHFDAIAGTLNTNIDLADGKAGDGETDYDFDCAAFAGRRL
jgi:hypothetical protein